MRSLYLREVIEEHHITECKLLRNLQRIVPGLRKGHVHPRQGLRPENMLARIPLTLEIHFLLPANSCDINGVI